MALDPQNVHTGFWENHISGATLTLTVGGVFYLNAFVQLLVTYAGGNLWLIINTVAFLIHARKSDLVGYQLQFQTIRANAVTGSSSIGSLIVLLHSYGRVGVRQCLRDRGVCFDLIFGTFMLCGVTALAIFIGNLIVASHSELLYYGSVCGLWTLPMDLVVNLTTEAYITSRILNDTNLAAAYSRECYDNPSGSPLCNTFVVPKVAWNEARDGACPFSGDLCSRPSLILDTGYMRSDRILGINSDPEDAVDARRLTTCAPLDITNHYSFNSVGYTYNLGSVGGGAKGLFGENVTAFVLLGSKSSGNVYGLASVTYTQGITINKWDPIAELQQSDADITLFGLFSNFVQYSEPVYDPFFEATQAIPSAFGPAVYVPSGPTQLAHFLACVDQFQIRDPRQPAGRNITTLGGWYTLEDAIRAASWSSPRQRAIALRVQKALWSSTMGYTTQQRDASSLLAYAKAFAFLSPGLPDDQWILEMSNLFGVSLARFQRELITYVAGPPQQAEVPVYLDAPAPPDQKFVCQSQKVMNSGAFVNIGTAKLFGVVAGCAVIIILSWFLESVLNCMKSERIRTRMDRLKRLRTLQLLQQLRDLDANGRIQLDSVHHAAANVETHGALISRDNSSASARQPVTSRAASPTATNSSPVSAATTMTMTREASPSGTPHSSTTTNDVSTNAAIAVGSSNAGPIRLAAMDDNSSDPHQSSVNPSSPYVSPDESHILDGSQASLARQPLVGATEMPSTSNVEQDDASSIGPTREPEEPNNSFPRV